MGPRLLLRTNRKSHTRFRLAPKSMTFDDLEWPKRHSCRKKNKISGAYQKNLNEDRFISLAAKCRPMILLARNIKYTQIRAGFHRGGASSRISANGFPAEHAHSRRGRLADKKSMVCAICVPVCHYHILRDACWSTWDIILYCNGLISNWMCTVSCFFFQRDTVNYLVSTT